MNINDIYKSLSVYQNFSLISIPNFICISEKIGYNRDREGC